MKNHEYNPDCGYAWMVVIACFAINFIMAGLARAAGVLYMALIQDYAVSRELATTPFSLRFCVRNMSGPLVGALGQRFGVRPVVLFGGLVCGIGGIICSFAPSITWITVGWGGLHGLGYGMSNIIHVIVINRYFQKYKGIALGISLTGDCFGTFLLPVLLEFLLPVYELRGTFLILAGISLNVVPAAMILRSPPWEQKFEKRQTPTENSSDMNTEGLNKYGTENKAFEYSVEDLSLCNKNQCSKQQLQSEFTLNDQAANEKLTQKQSCSPTLFQNKIINNVQVACNSNVDVFSQQNIKNKCDQKAQQASSLRLFGKSEINDHSRFNFPVYNMNRKNSNISVYNINRKNSNISVLSCPTYVGKPSVEYLCKSVISDPLLLPPSPKQQIDNGLEATTLNNKSHVKENSAIFNSNPSRKLSNSSEILMNFCLSKGLNDVEFSKSYSLEKITEPNFDGISTIPNQGSALKQFIKTNLKPIFLLICADLALYVFLFIAVFTIIIDYVSDNNMPNEYGKYLIIAFSVTDLFGRIGFGFVLDKQWIANSHYAGLTTGLMGLFIFVMPFSKSFMFWIISFSVCGFIQGGVAIMYPILVEHYMEKNEETVALGCLNFYGGLLMLPIPPMIGYFRDIVGSYDGVFWTTGGLCMFAGCLWLLEPCLVRRNQNKNETSENYSDEQKL